MRLVIKDEHVRWGSLFGVGCRLVHFDGAYLEEGFAESLVDRDKGRGQTARALEELSAADPELFRGGLSQLLDPELRMLLLFGLRMRHILAV